MIQSIYYCFMVFLDCGFDYIKVEEKLLVLTEG